MSDSENTTPEQNTEQAKPKADKKSSDKITLPKVTAEGKTDGSLEVDASVFGMKPNVHVVHLAVRRELANGRAGTACAKTRAEVRGGGRKPWKQKGTGRARAGSIRSPLWVGGGRSHGPVLRDFSFKLPKKVRVLALKSALSNAQTKFQIIEDFSWLSGPKTKAVASLLEKLNASDKKVLILADLKASENQHLALSARNLRRVRVSLPSNLSVRDLLDADVVVATRAAVESINDRYADEKDAAHG